MKRFVISGMVLTAVLFLVCIGFADEISNGSNADTERWVGTWTDANYSLTIEQNGSEFIGIGIPFNFDTDYTFSFSGSLSEDGTELQTIMTDSGTREMHISEDLMSFTGNGTINPVNDSYQPFAYEIYATRNGTPVDPENIWTGEWLSENNYLITFNQDGDSVNGTAYPLLDPEFLEEFEGKLSDEGKTFFIEWTTSQNVNYILSDDGMYLIETECGEDEIAKGEICFNFTKQIKV